MISLRHQSSNVATMRRAGKEKGLLKHYTLMLREPIPRDSKDRLSDSRGSC